MLTNWNQIVESTKEVLESTCIDLLHTTLSYSKNLVMADGLAASIFQGTYFIRLKGVPSVDDTVNSQFNVRYTIALELCYMISAGDSVTDYNNAIDDIEVVIRERMKQDSWKDYPYIQIVEMSSIDEPKYLLRGETFMIIPINFDFTMISNY